MEFGTSYFGVRNREHAVTDLDDFDAAGLNAVLHTFSERDRKYYRGTMSDMVDASHDRGFDVYVNPWAVGRVFGGEALSEFIGRHPDARQVVSTGGRAPAACFNHPDFRTYMREWTRDAAGLGADVLFWDEPHWFLPAWHEREYPDGAWGCRCSHCRERYERRYDEPMPREQTDDVRAFKAAELLEFLTEMMAIGREEGVENAVCLLPSEDADHGLEDWESLATNDHLDVLATDPYWDVFPEAGDPAAFVGRFSEKVAGMADEHDLRSQIWIQNFRLPAGAADDVRTATRTAIDAGVDSVFAWGYRGCESISSIACEEPAAAWEAYLEAARASR